MHSGFIAMGLVTSPLYFFLLKRENAKKEAELALPEGQRMVHSVQELRDLGDRYVDDFPCARQVRELKRLSQRTGIQVHALEVDGRGGSLLVWIGAVRCTEKKHEYEQVLRPAKRWGEVRDIHREITARASQTIFPQRIMIDSPGREKPGEVKPRGRINEQRTNGEQAASPRGDAPNQYRPQSSLLATLERKHDVLGSRRSDRTERRSARASKRRVCNALRARRSQSFLCGMRKVFCTE